MAAISAALVKELRERTGLGMMECKKALQAVDGDIEKAIEEMRKSGQAKAAKKAGRTAAEGAVATKVAEDGSFAVMVEVNSETDFAARDENFLAFVETVLGAAFDRKEADVAALMAGELEETRQALIQKIGENISVRRIKLVEGGRVDAYVHGNKKIAVLVALSAGESELARDIAMHVAAVNPQVVNKEDMPAELVEKEKEIFKAQAEQSGKPAEIIEKMIGGRINKFLAESSLVEQPFVKNPEVKVGALAKQAGATVESFVRFEVGEGIEVAEVDFAAEVRAQAGL
ncbi:elongation factor Ts [Endozoicomonas sp. OPT23]|uniref:translation elongation factor Ts n=1 Tax=Endozoicomonas sp. OPT23 TaxID=2072845 RepID=UPI00129A8F07|nr:translation elongation factor Ts [Endozoicomonas sp. OPT23]MRI34958.1 elongation factor Ts [Endozoicomonas sp. OPT23]